MGRCRNADQPPPKIHIAEEASNAAQAVPLAIMLNGGIGGMYLPGRSYGRVLTPTIAILGFVIMIVLASCISPDIESVIASSYGQPVRTPRHCPTLLLTVLGR